MDNVNIMRLKNAWKTRLQHKDLAPEWQSFNAFLSWAEENGYGEGSGIRKINNDMPAGPFNCYIYNYRASEKPTDEKTTDTPDRKGNVTIEDAVKWDKTVKMFRYYLARASLIAESTLIHRIRSGTMPKEWYPQNP